MRGLLIELTQREGGKVLTVFFLSHLFLSTMMMMLLSLTRSIEKGGRKSRELLYLDFAVVIPFARQTRMRRGNKIESEWTFATREIYDFRLLRRMGDSRVRLS